MKIDFGSKILSLNNEPVKDPQTGEEVTLKAVTSVALLNDHPSEQINGDEKAKRFLLALTINQATEPMDVKAEDAALLKRLLANIYPPLIVGRAYQFLDG